MSVDDVYAMLPQEHGLHAEEFPEEFPNGWYLRAYCPVQATDTKACAKCYEWKPGNGRSGKGHELNSRAWTAREMFDIIVRHLMGNAHNMSEQDARDMALKEVLDCWNNLSEWVERVAMSAEDRKWWLHKEAVDKEPDAEKGSGKGKKGKGKDGEQQGVKRARSDGAGSGQAAAVASGGQSLSATPELAAAVASIGQTLSEAVAGALQPLQQQQQMHMGGMPGSASGIGQRQLMPMRSMQPVNIGLEMRTAAIEIHGAARKLAKMARMTSELCEREADKVESILTSLGVVLPQHT